VAKQSKKSEKAAVEPSGADSVEAATEKTSSETTVATAQQPKQFKVEKSCSRGLAAFLAQAKLSLAFTSYQTGRLYFVGVEPKGRISFFERVFERAMGVVGDSQRIYMGGLYQLWRFENILKPNQRMKKTYDKVYVPRNAQTIGDLDIHELGIRKNGKVVFVNTKYSCLAEPSVTDSFKAIWKPDFISKLAPEDRCHLNGLAMVNREPKYVSAVCKSDSVDGWRDRRHDGGVIIDIDSNEIVCEGLSMPHSPRWANGKLWVLNAGSGEIGHVDFENKKFVPLAFCPGFLRGMSIHGNIAAVGLSKPRNKRFEGLALDQGLQDKDADAWCGIQFINLATGDVQHWIRLEGDITELFDVTFLHGVSNPMLVGMRGNEIRELITFEDATAGPSK